MTSDAKDEDRMIEDPYMSGRYMVTRIRHHVTKDANQYTMVIEMISDTVFKEYDINDKTVDVESISIKVEDEPMELEEDTIEVSTSKNSEIIVDAYNAIDRKRRNMKLGTTIVTEERKNV